MELWYFREHHLVVGVRNKHLVLISFFARYPCIFDVSIDITNISNNQCMSFHYFRNLPVFITGWLRNHFYVLRFLQMIFNLYLQFNAIFFDCMYEPADIQKESKSPDNGAI